MTTIQWIILGIKLYKALKDKDEKIDDTILPLLTEELEGQDYEKKSLIDAIKTLLK